MRKRTGYLIKRGKVYYACWNVGNKKFVITTGKTDRREAEAELQKRMAPFRVGDELESLKNIAARIETQKDEVARLDAEQNPPLTIDKSWATFEKSPNRPDSGPNTLKQYAAEFNRFKKWITAHHAAVLILRDVTPEIAEAYAQDLNAAKVTPSTFNQHINFLRLLWKILQRVAKTESNPWGLIARKKQVKIGHRKRALTPEQLTDLLSAAEKIDPELRDLLFFLAWTGQRLIDGIRLRWDAIDIEHGVIVLYPVKTARREGKAVYIPMFPPLKVMLQKRRAIVTKKELVFPRLASEYKRDSSEVSKTIRRVFEKIGLDTNESREGLGRNVVLYGAHSLRHYFITAASAAGMPATMIKAITGHATDNMMEHYQHFDAKIAGEFARKISAAGMTVEAPQVDLLGRFRERLTTMTASNWEAVKGDLLAMLSEDSPDAQTIDVVTPPPPLLSPGKPTAKKGRG